MKCTCSYSLCSKPFEMGTGNYNRAMKANGKTYCSKNCFYLGRKGTGRTLEEKKRIKAEYDKKFRYYHKAGIKERKAAAFKKDYAANPEKYKKERQRRYKAHLEYLQTDKYKAWKKEYDKKHCAKKSFGIYWESALILNELEELLINNRSDGTKFQMGITNKTQKRKRLWQKQLRQKNSLQQT